MIVMQRMMDGSCQHLLTMVTHFLKFNGSNSSVTLGDIFDQGAYTKAWVWRDYGYNVNNNILSGNTGHVLYAPFSQGGRLSFDTMENYTTVQDPDSIPEAVWTFVAVYSPSLDNGTMKLYKSGIKVMRRRE